MFEREARTSPVEQGSEPGDSSTLAPGRVTFLDDGPLPPVAVGTEQPPAPTASELAFDGAHGDAIARPHPTPARRVADRGAKQAAGRLPQNHELAGKQFPADLLPAKYRAKGVKFTPEGYPDFAPHAKQLPNGKTSVEIEYTGSRRADYAAANRKAGLSSTPLNYTWHHVEDGKTMILVPSDLHEDFVKHTGGVATYKHGRGVAAYGK